jgi:hypothetical protein
MLPLMKINLNTEVIVTATEVGHAPVQAAVALPVNTPLTAAMYDPYMYILHTAINEIKI